jgi:hypothetical protein
MKTSREMRLLSQDELQGFGNVGEGMAIQLTRDKRRVLWLAHESGPKNVTAVDVTNPRKPSVIVQTDLPHDKMRSNSLEVVGDMLVVAYQTAAVGLKPAGIEIFDVADPAKPKSIGFFDASGPHSRGTHHLWFVDGQYIHCASGAHDFTPKNPKDDQFYRIIDVRNPSKPTEVGRWWLPGTRDTDPEPALPRHPKFDAGYRAHNTNVYPKRPDRAYIGYLDGGAIVLDISDMARPKQVMRWDYHPPMSGFCHTVLPLLDRGLLVVTDEATKPHGEDYPKLVWIVDVHVENKPVSIATCPMPPLKPFFKRGGRFGAHNLHENRPVPGVWISENVIVGTFFNGGVRAFDVSNPFAPVEVAYAVPPAPRKSRLKAIQINDVLVDDRGVCFAVDRIIGGLYAYELKV